MKLKKSMPMSISNELVSVKPLGKPSGILFYVDLNDDMWRLKERKKKLDKILEKIKKNIIKT